MSDSVVPANPTAIPAAQAQPTPTSGAPHGSGVARGRHGRPIPRGMVQRQQSNQNPADAAPVASSSRPELPGGARRLTEPSLPAPEVVMEPERHQEEQPLGPTSMTAEEMANAPGTILPPREGFRQGGGGDRGGQRREGGRGGREGGRDNRRSDGPPPAKAEQIYSHGFGYGKSMLKNFGAGSLEAELEEALGGRTAESLLGASQAAPPPPPASPGGYRVGKVVRVQGHEVFVSLPGSRAEGLMLVNSIAEAPAMGADVEVRIEGYDSANGLMKLALKGATSVDTDWESLAVGMVVEARVTGHNKGGLEVLVGAARGFMPVSQIDMGRVEQMEVWVNQRVRCVVTRLERAEKNMVLSRRQLLEDERKEIAEKTWAELEEGQIRDATIRSVMDFGAFADLGGVDGLIPVRELAWGRVGHPSEVVKVGDKVKVKVLKIDTETRKVSLGLRQMMENPWDAFANMLQVGTTLRGKVTRLAEFGAFVEIEPAVEGLVHLSELAPHRVRRPQDVVKVGDEMDVVVLSIDMETKRIGLSVRAAILAAQQKNEEPEEREEISAHIPPPKPRPRPEGLRGGTGPAGPLISLG